MNSYSFFFLTCKLLLALASRLLKTYTFAFARYLSELCHEQGISKSYGFCDSNILAPQTPTITTTKEGDPRSDYLARAFLCDADNHKKLFLAPYIEQ